jgi:uncharacterized membrane protein
MRIAVEAVTPLVQHLPQAQVGGIAIATVAAVILLVALCYGAGVLARAALGRRLSTTFEDKLAAIYPRYQVIKAMSQGLHSAIGRQLLQPVLVSFDDHQQLAYDIERLPDGQAVIFVPGAPDAWSGDVMFVEPSRLRPLAIDSAALTRALQGMGRGLGALLPAETATRASGS